METMQAWVVEAWGEAPVLRQMPVPEPGPGEVLIRVRACGVGQTVLNVIQGNQTSRDPNHLPRIPGHEIAGEVAALGPGVQGLRVGERVVTHFYLTCGACSMCRAARESLCQNFRGYVGAHQDGGYAEYARLPARNCFLLPEGMDWAAATAIPDAILTPLHICRSRARIGPSDRVLVLGAGGGVGIHMVQMARLFGAEVWGVEAGPLKLPHVREVGAADAFDFHQTSPERLRELAGEMSVAVDFVGRPESLAWAAAALGPGGTLVMLTTFPGVTTPLSPREAVLKELTFMGSRYGSHTELELAIDLVARGRIRPVVSETAPLAEAERLHDRIRAGTLLGRGALTIG